MIEALTPTEVRFWPLERLRPSPYNPRGPVDPASVVDLAQSIREQGIIQPLVATPDGTVLVGHRRLAAAQVARLAEVPVIVREAATPAEQIAIALAENIQRQDLTILQEANAYRQLLDSGYSQADIAREVGVQLYRLRNCLMVLRLVPEVQGMFDRGELPITLGPVLVKIPDPQTQRRLATIAARRRLSVPALEAIVERGHGAIAAHKPKTEPRRIQVAPQPDGRLSRNEALATLERLSKRSVTFAQLAKLMDATCEGVCADCGLSFAEDVCRDCALPTLVKRLVEQ